LNAKRHCEYYKSIVDEGNFGFEKIHQEVANAHNNLNVLEDQVVM
jgi:hypothetical protein